MYLKPSHNGFNLFFVWLIIVFFGSMIKKKSRHTSFYLQNSNLPFDMRSNDSWPAHDSFPMILENRNKLDVDGYDKKRGNRIFAPPQEEKDGNPIMLSIH